MLVLKQMLCELCYFNYLVFLPLLAFFVFLLSDCLLVSFLFPAADLLGFGLTDLPELGFGAALDLALDLAKRLEEDGWALRGLGLLLSERLGVVSSSEFSGALAAEVSEVLELDGLEGSCDL